MVAKWNLYNGGIDTANEQEQIRRLAEERLRLDSILREVEEALRSAWNSRSRQSELASTLAAQSRAGKNVVEAYEEQFTAGKRTLLDVLSAQNTYFNTEVLRETAHYAAAFAEYRILASVGGLVAALGLEVSPAADAYARVQARVPEADPADTNRRYSPDRDDNPYLEWHAVVEPTWHAAVAPE